MKEFIKRINNTTFGRIILFIPMFVCVFTTRFFKRILPGYFYSYLYYYTGKIYKNNDLTIGVQKLGKKRTRFPHPISIVIGTYVEIGYDCIIYQNVTIGSKTIKDSLNKKYPQIGNNVIIGANALLIGDIKIGNNVYIGAGTFVNKDIPNNSLAYGNPLTIKFR